MAAKGPQEIFCPPSLCWSLCFRASLLFQGWPLDLSLLLRVEQTWIPWMSALLLPLCIMARERGYSILLDFLMISHMFAGLCPQLWGTESLKKPQTHLCAQCCAEVSCFPKCTLTSLLFLPGSLCAAASCGCFSDLYTFLLESDDFYLPRHITQSIPHSDTMSLSAHSNCHTAPRRASLSINNTCPDFLNSWSSSLIHLHVNDLSYDKQVHLQLESHLITYFPYYINRNIYCSPLCVEQCGNYRDGFCTPLAALTWFNMGWLTSPLTQCFPWMRGRQATYKELVDLCHETGEDGGNSFQLNEMLKLNSELLSLSLYPLGLI